jgi:tetratricopeptide (TPR) repeat protein
VFSSLLLQFLLTTLLGLSPTPAPPAMGTDGPDTPLAPALTGLGTLHHPVSTDNQAAQQFFDQGLRLLYAFNHPESLRAFKEAARLDPTLAMAHWGQAMALSPNLNAPMTPENGRLAYAAIQQARALAATRATAVERDLIEALALRLPADGAGDAAALAGAYAEAMTRVAATHPQDADVQTLLADALMNTMPWDYYQKDGSPKPDTTRVMTTLERVVAAHPDHPGAHHYYIHLLEASNDPDRAVPSADRLGALMPAAGHMVHMPSHIYIRVGRYADAAAANVKAIEADEDYLSQCQAQGLYPLSYYPHNLHFLWAAATFEGRSRVAIDAARDVAAKVPHHHAGAVAWNTDFPVTPLLAYVRFGQWRAILTEPAPPTDQPYPNGIWHYARGMAFVAGNRLDRAEAEVAALAKVLGHDAFATTLKDSPLHANLQIASRTVEAELAGRRGRFDEAVRLAEAAVALEDALPYNEPPVWHQSPRHVLGALLLEAGHPTDAERVYREDLARFRENGWALFGLMQSLEAQGRHDEARAVRARYEKAWERADVALTSSRILG